ncbi:MAG: LysR substrate-binding domain-containing protein [Caulobacteraceae bacterium]
MQEIHFHNLDLNLLRVFDALYEERSVTRAGRRLGLTQSAVSHALNRMRTSLQDELFLRGPDGMTPTPRASQVWPDVRRGLEQLQRALAGPQFDAATTDRRFRIAAPPAISSTLLPPVVREVRTLAPNAELRIERLRGDVRSALESGAIDVALGSFPRLPDIISRETLVQEPMVWVVRNGHPGAGTPLTVKALGALPLLMLAIGDETRPAGPERRVLIDDGGAWERALGGPSARKNIRATVDDVHAALRIIAEDDLAGLLPRRVSALWAKSWNLKLLDPPYPSQPLTVEMLWREDAAGDPAVQWLLGVMRAGVAGAISS